MALPSDFKPWIESVSMHWLNESHSRCRRSNLFRQFGTAAPSSEYSETSSGKKSISSKDSKATKSSNCRTALAVSLVEGMHTFNQCGMARVLIPRRQLCIFNKPGFTVAFKTRAHPRAQEYVITFGLKAPATHVGLVQRDRDRGTCCSISVRDLNSFQRLPSQVNSVRAQAKDSNLSQSNPVMQAQLVQ